MTITLCHCGEPFYQTDDGLMCKRGHGEQPDPRTKWEPRGATEKPLAEGGSTALPGSVPVGVTGDSVPDPVKQILPVGAFRTEDHRYYWNGKGPFPSVTTILNDVLAKHALIAWKSQQVARAILRDPKAWNQAQWDGGDDAAVKWALAEADKQRDEAARIGSSVHLLADLQARMPLGASEKAVEGFQVSEGEIPYLEAFRGFLAFLEARGARIVSSEHMVWSENGYAGTYDLILEMPTGKSKTGTFDGQSIVTLDEKQLWLVDIKTSKGIYPEYALQLVAYGKADQIILEGTPVGFPMPKIDRYAVLHLRPDQYPESGWKLWEYPVTDEDYFRFISTLDLYLWRKEDRYTKRNLVPVT